MQYTFKKCTSILFLGKCASIADFAFSNGPLLRCLCVYMCVEVCGRVRMCVRYVNNSETMRASEKMREMTFIDFDIPCRMASPRMLSFVTLT